METVVEESPKKKLLARHSVKLVVAQVLAAFVLGLLVHWGLASGERTLGLPPGAESQTAKSAVGFWTCVMHPYVVRKQPGDCPKCGMKLVLVTSLGAQGPAGERRLTVSPAARELMRIETTPVERRFPTAEVRMVGKVEYDETKLGYITAWIPGRLDRLYVDYTGVEVKQGDHMVSLYSPKLLSAQDELIQALKSAKERPATSSRLGRIDLVGSAREKLRLWGLTGEQIKAIEASGTPSDHMTIFSPMSGIVIHKNAQQGMYVETGERIYTIADLSQVWVKLDAYESDLVWLRYRAEVGFTTAAYPGKTFRGRIAFIDPVLDESTRTVKVRVNVPNDDGKLKPGMFVRAVVEANVAQGGRVMVPELAGKWISPMHPEIVKDGPGKCDVCGMALVPAESLGYIVSESDEGAKPLVIPVTAPLKTGTRAVVYVEVPDAEYPTYEGREVVLGPRAGDYYLVASGLEEGELVVTNGNFKIDSALQIQAKASMMSPEGGGGGSAHQHQHGDHASGGRHE